MLMKKEVKEVIYPGTLGRFLTVQVLCHLEKEKEEPLACHIAVVPTGFWRIKVNQCILAGVLYDVPHTFSQNSRGFAPNSPLFFKKGTCFPSH